MSDSLYDINPFGCLPKPLYHTSAVSCLLKIILTLDRRFGIKSSVRSQSGLYRLGGRYKMEVRSGVGPSGGIGLG